MNQLELQSQQLVDILLQLGFRKIYSSFDEDYLINELNVYWDNEVNYVFNLCVEDYSKDSNICIQDINEKSLATNIAYFQKKLDEKLKQDSQNASN